MRKWFALLAICGAVVVSGVAFGLTGSDAPPTTTEAKDEIVEQPERKPASDYWHEEDWDREETAQPDEPKPVDEPPQPPVKEPEADTTPPGLEILHPVDGQVFESKEVVFEGITEPGARVFAGEYEADVRDDGSWRIVLFLSPGSNHATLRAKDKAGNVSEDSVTVVFERGEEPKDEEEPKHEEEPREEQPPKDDHEEGEQVWEFSANQVYGECSENPPYDVFFGTGKPGTRIRVISEYGSGDTEVNDHGEWELKVYFEEAPIGKGILVKVVDDFEHSKTFEFTRTG
jgi:hypothetical protein